MTPATAASTTTARLAHVLCARAAETLPLLDGDARLEALHVLDAFVAAPLPSRFLHAARTLRDLSRARRRSSAWQALGERAFVRARERLAEIPGLDAVATTLAALPADRDAARRLDALAALVSAHQELAGRLRDDDGTRKSLIAELAAVRVERRVERRRRR